MSLQDKYDELLNKYSELELKYSKTLEIIETTTKTLKSLEIVLKNTSTNFQSNREAMKYLNTELDFIKNTLNNSSTPM